MKKDKLTSRIKRYKDKYELYLKLENILKSKQLYRKYELSDLHREIIRRFLKESSSKTSEVLGINKSLIYAIIDKCKEIKTIEEINSSNTEKLKEGKNGNKNNQ